MATSIRHGCDSSCLCLCWDFRQQPLPKKIRSSELRSYPNLPVCRGLSRCIQLHTPRTRSEKQNHSRAVRVSAVCPGEVRLATGAHGRHLPHDNRTRVMRDRRSQVLHISRSEVHGGAGGGEDVPENVAASNGRVYAGCRTVPSRCLVGRPGSADILQVFVSRTRGCE